LKNIIFASGTYIAALVGAGLATGAEITSFFVKYGKSGGIGIFICSLIFAWFFYAVLQGCKRTGTDNFSDYISAEFGKNVAAVCKSAIVLFMICVYSVMISGAGELAHDLFGVDKLLFMLIFNAFCVIISTLPIEKIMNICGILGLILAAFIMVFCIRASVNRGIETFKLTDSFAVSAVSYSGYNIISCICILCPMTQYIRSKKEMMLSGAISGIMIFLILVCMWGVLSIYYGKIDLGIFPMLTLVKRQGYIFYLIYTLIIFIAIFTTALSNAYGIYKEFSGCGRNVLAVCSIFFISALIAYIGFETLVNEVYRLCGFVGFMIPVGILYKNTLISMKNSDIVRKIKKKRDNII